MDNPILSLILPFVIVTVILIGAAYAVLSARNQRQQVHAAGSLREADVERLMRDASEEADRLIEEARSRAKELILEAKEDSVLHKAEAERHARERQAEMQKREQRMTTREEHLERKVEQFEKRERTQVFKEQLADQKTAEAEALRASQLRELERISNLTEESARAELIARIEGSAREEATQRIREIEQQTKEEAARRARWIVAQAIQRCASDTSIELTQTSVSIPSEEMKGRIIGKEGRNIRALEAATGVDLIIDDTPETVILSSFDPIRREIARVSLLKLLSDGRIHPTRIEELVAKSKTEVEQQMKDDGERAAYEAGVPGLNVELVKLLGRLKFRSSYGQNQLQHSLEVSFLAGAMAAEVGADIAVCRRAGLLHDIGKALDHEIEGPHALIGADFARKHAVPPRVVHAIQAHHFEVDPQTVEAFLVAAADAISASRPGARRETVDNYIKRLEALEGVASSFSGVDKAYALQAGREVRILVKPDQVNEDEAWSLSRDIVKRIEETMDFPGQIKVTVIRETRVVDYAR